MSIALLLSFLGLVALGVPLAVALGLAGVGILVGPSRFAGAERIDPIGAGAQPPAPTTRSQTMHDLTVTESPAPQ